VNFFSPILTQNKIAESRAKFHKFWYKIALVCKKVLKNSPEINFFLNIHPQKNKTVSHTRNLPFSPGNDE